MEYVKLIGGLIILILSGDYLVKGAVSIASKFKISPLVIGMTIVAFGTSAPELLVSLQAAIKGNAEIAIGNVVGSNISNIALILGATSLIYPLVVQGTTLRFDWPVMMGATLLFTWAASDGIISSWEGGIGFAFLIAYTIWQIYYSRKNHITPEEEQEKPLNITVSIIMIVLSCVGLSLGARFLIEGASSLALSWGVSERIIGVTIIAFGTSLPELAASVSAALKKETDIAVGNIIGSNLFNILSVIGLTSLIKPINVAWTGFKVDFMVMIFFSLLLFILMLPLKKLFKKKEAGEKLKFLTQGKLGRIGGIILFLGYILYIYMILI